MSRSYFCTEHVYVLFISVKLCGLESKIELCSGFFLVCVHFCVGAGNLDINVMIGIALAGDTPPYLLCLSQARAQIPIGFFIYVFVLKLMFKRGVIRIVSYIVDQINTRAMQADDSNCKFRSSQDGGHEIR